MKISVPCSYISELAFFLEGSQALPIFSSDKNNMLMKMSMEHWWMKY
jgi:hypothetical protein